MTKPLPMDVEIREVKDRLQQREFIRFPYRLYRNTPNWLPPLLREERKFYNPAENTGFAACDTVRFCAYRHGSMTGRIMGIIHHQYNRLHHEKTGRFFAFDCMEDRETAWALLRAVESWCRSKGMKQVVGPFGFSDKDPQGTMIYGFDQRGTIIAPYSHSYYMEFIAGCGYTKMVDLVEYLVAVPAEVPAFYLKICGRILRNPSVRCVEFENKQQLKPYIVPILRLMCETFEDIYGTVALTDDEMKKLAADYMPVLDPDFIKVVEMDGEPVAFILGLPDFGPGLKKAGGRLFPFGFYHILRELKRTRYLILLLGGIRKAYQGKGLDALMGTRMLESAIRRGYTSINSHLELETNLRVRAEMERAGGEIFKKYRIFQKAL